MRVDQPYDQEIGKVKRGYSEIRLGELTFFQHPHEIMTEKRKIPILSEDQSIVLMA